MDGLVFMPMKARAFKAKATSSRPRPDTPKATQPRQRNLAFRPRINIPDNKQHGGALLGRKISKKITIFASQHPGPDLAPYCHPTLATFVWRLITTYSVRYYTIQNMFSINFSPCFCLQPQLFPQNTPPQQTITSRLSHLVDCNFIIRMPFYQFY